MLKKCLSLLIILILCLSVTGCSGKAKVIKPYLFNENLQTNNIASVIAAENEKFQLSWDSENRRVLLTDKADGYVYSNIPNELLNEEDTSEMRSDLYLKIFSSITIDCIRTETYEVKTGYGSEVIDDGDFSVSQIDNGIRVTYIFKDLKVSVPVQYVLFDDGIRIKVDPTKIAEEGKEYFIHTIAVAPFMCSAKNMTENSYILYPSGSGALVYMDTESDISSVYSSEIYGTDGMSDRKTWAEESNEEAIKMPVYGSKFGNRGMFAIVDGAAESGTIILDAFNKHVGYSTVYSEFSLRGETNVSNKFLLGAENSMKYADALNLTEISVSFYPLKNEEASYAAMANIYREYLADNGFTRKEDSKDLTVKLLGGAMIDASVLGVPTRRFFATTTLDEANEIVEEITKSTGANLNVDLVGYGESGMHISEIAGGFTVEKKLGGKKDLKSFVKALKEKGNNVFFDFDIIGINNSGSGFSATTDVAVTTTKQKFGKIKYRLATDNSDGTLFYFISRNKIVDVADKMINKAKDFGLDAVALDSASNLAYSDYSNQKYYSKAGMSDDISTIFKKCAESKLNVMANDANSYAAMNADVIVDVPLTSSKHDAFKYDIPFYQMVFSGYVPMYSSSLNLTNNENELLLRSIEAGVSLSYTIMKNYNGLLKKEFDFYHSVCYDDLKDTIFNTYKATSGYYESIKGSEISEHHILQNGLRKTVFSNGVTVYVNYGEAQVDTPLGAVESGSFVYGKN